MMATYPAVVGELETMALVKGGRSLARYGDGEFALAENRSIKNQPFEPQLSARLRGILQGHGAPCLVGIPNILSKTPKANYWQKYKRCAVMLSSSQVYVSSFISRPDNAPWMDVPSFWASLDGLWAGKDVTLVRGEDPPSQVRGMGARSFVAAELTGARSVTEVIGPAVNAWAVYPALLEQIGRPVTALLCLGVTATVMAVDLCAQGVHAIDLGHLGTFRTRHLKGLPMARTTAEKRAGV